MKEMFKLAFVISLALLGSCNQIPRQNNSTNSADAIYYGGDIIIMEGVSPSYPEALAVKGGKVIFVGTKADAEKMKGDSIIFLARRVTRTIVVFIIRNNSRGDSATCNSAKTRNFSIWTIG